MEERDRMWMGASGPDEPFGTVTVHFGPHVQFGHKAQVYMILLEMAGTDVIASYSGDTFTMPNMPKGTYRAIVDALSEHPSCPSFRFKPRGSMSV